MMFLRSDYWDIDWGNGRLRDQEVVANFLRRFDDREYVALLAECGGGDVRRATTKHLASLVRRPATLECVDAAKRLEQALEMWDDGVQLKRESLRRQLPAATAEEIENELSRWLAGPDPVTDGFRLVQWPRTCDDKAR